MIRHIFWDWNGTLADDATALHHAVNAGMTAIGLEPVSMTELRARFARPLSTLYEHLTGVDYSDRWPDWHDAFLAATHESESAPALARDALASVRHWHARGRTQSVVSRWPHGDLTNHISATEVHLYLDGIRGALTPDEPKAHMLREQLALRKLLRDQAVLIGDTLDDAEAARAVGIPVIICDAHSFTPCDEETLEQWQIPRVESLRVAVDLTLVL